MGDNREFVLEKWKILNPLLNSIWICNLIALGLWWTMACRVKISMKFFNWRVLILCPCFNWNWIRTVIIFRFFQAWWQTLLCANSFLFSYYSVVWNSYFIKYIDISKNSEGECPASPPKKNDVRDWKRNSGLYRQKDGFLWIISKHY